MLIHAAFRKNLVKDAVPSIFLWNQCVKKIKKRRIKKDFLNELLSDSIKELIIEKSLRMVIEIVINDMIRNSNQYLTDAQIEVEVSSEDCYMDIPTDTDIFYNRT